MGLGSSGGRGSSFVRAWVSGCPPGGRVSGHLDVRCHTSDVTHGFTHHTVRGCPIHPPTPRGQYNTPIQYTVGVQYTQYTSNTHPTYDFSYQLANADGGQAELTVSLVQSGVSESFQMSLPVYQVIKGQQQFLGLIKATGTKPVKTALKLPARPEKIILDPERSILAEIHQ
jgi:hypothetical protein